MSRHTWVVGLGLVLLVAGFGCKPKTPPIVPFEQTGKDYSKPLPPGALALRKIDPADYPDFSRGYYNRIGLEDSIRNSLSYLNKPSSRKFFPYGDITHERAVASLQKLQEVLAQAGTPEELNQLICNDFEVYQSVGCDDCGTMYFTGYYCPIFEGRKKADAQFRYPLYSLPSDLAKDDDGRILGGRRPDGSTEPYYTRRQIEEGNVLRGHEIAWLKDPFEAYVVTVQGSAKLRLADGSLYELGYAANNGYPYTSVGQMLVKEGLIDANELSLQSMIQYFASRPDQIRPYCWKNDRYVFFREAPGGPFGSLNVPVLPFRSIATDKEVFPRACPAFLVTELPLSENGQVRTVPYEGFAMDQDTGGAIRAAGRCDVFMGIGAMAEALAGRTGAEGRLYYVFIRPDLAPTGASTAQFGSSQPRD